MHQLIYIVCLLSMLVVVLDARLIVRVDEVPSKNSTDMYNCYVRYVSEPVDNGVIIYHYNEDKYSEPIRSARVVINVLAESSYLRRIDYLPGLVIIVTTKIEIFEPMFKAFALSPDSYMRTRYLIVYLGKELTDKILEVAWRAYIVNIAVLRKGDTSVCTYFPYGHGECGARIRSEVLGQCQQLSLAALYPAKVPKVFNGCTLRISTSRTPPLVIDPRANTGDPEIDGFENVMVNIIVERLNLSKRLNVGELQEIVHANGENSYWAPILNIYVNISDMSFGGYHVAINPILLYEPSYMYYMSPIVWLAPLAGPGAQWMSVIVVFQRSMWHAVLGFYLLNTFVWWIFGRTTNRWPGSYLDCLLGSLFVLLNGSVPFPKRTVMRFLVTSWTVCSLVVIAAYQCQFLGILLKPVYEKQVTNEREIVESRVPVILGPIQGETLRNINEYYSDLILRHSHILNLSEYLKYVDHGKKTAVFMEPLHTVTYRGMYSDRNGRPTVYVFKEPIYTVPICMCFRRGHPLLDRWNELLMQFVESGILSKFVSDVDNTPPDLPEEPEKVPITLHHLSSAFYIVLFGYTVALLAFLVEQIVHRIKKGIQTCLRRQR